jgi:hypothetical protein
MLFDSFPIFPSATLLVDPVQRGLLVDAVQFVSLLRKRHFHPPEVLQQR